MKKKSCSDLDENCFPFYACLNLLPVGGCVIGRRSGESLCLCIQKMLFSTRLALVVIW